MGLNNKSRANSAKHMLKSQRGKMVGTLFSGSTCVAWLCHLHQSKGSLLLVLYWWVSTHHAPWKLAHTQLWNLVHILLGNCVICDKRYSKYNNNNNNKKEKKRKEKKKRACWFEIGGPKFELDIWSLCSFVLDLESDSVNPQFFTHCIAKGFWIWTPHDLYSLVLVTQHPNFT